MSKKSIGIDITQDKLYAVQVALDKDSYCVEKCLDVPLRRQSDRLEDILNSLTSEHGFDKKAKTACALSESHILFRNIDQQIVEQRFDQETPEWVDEFPFESDEIELEGYNFHHQSEQANVYLMAAAEKEVLLQKARAFKQSQLKPQLMDSPISALISLSRFQCPELMKEAAILLYLDQQWLNMIILKNDEVELVRRFPFAQQSYSEEFVELLVRELEISWRMTFNQGVSEKVPIIFSGQARNQTLVSALEEQFLCEPVLLNLTDNILDINDQELSEEYTIAQGIAMCAFESEEGTGCNFAKISCETSQQQSQYQKRTLITTVVLVVAIALVAVAGVMIKFQMMESQYQTLKDQSRVLFSETLPQEKNIVDELSQSQAYLAALEKEWANVSPLLPRSQGPLSIYSVISQTQPKRFGVSLTKCWISKNIVLVSAQAASEKNASSWIKELRRMPVFERVQIVNPKTETKSDLYDFTLEMICSESFL